MQRLSLYASGTNRDALKVAAALAGFSSKTGRSQEAEAQLRSCVARVYHGTLDFNGRFDSARALLLAVRTASGSFKTAIAAELISQLGQFGDNFTTSRFYSMYKLLILEQLVDLLCAPSADAMATLARDDGATLQRLAEIGAIDNRAIGVVSAPSLQSILPDPRPVDPSTFV